MAAGLLLCGLPAFLELLRGPICRSVPGPDEALILETARGDISVIGAPEEFV